MAPPASAVTRAATGRSSAMGSPSMEYVAAMESTPVWGVAMRNDTVAPCDAPSRRSPMAVGTTPHEHSGSGMPNRAAFTTEPNVGGARWARYTAGGTNACSTPAMAKPRSRYGAISQSMLQNIFRMFIASDLFSAKLSRKRRNPVAIFPGYFTDTMVRPGLERRARR